ncbi:transcriptional regulator, TetR family [Filimonas lacunae]|uniref:Transcriptional regulator, TetR family n=2 Tax=Filimonas lacunae TaxID=477680 RepID=A0A173MBP4_9BACT|nr:transcriptional regulator, TetR family [Filimonas lacunae]SIT33800.1 transcriptional regulator, TetR family [Filimonas lacunae]
MGKAERTKQMIIEKASIILNKKGVEGTTVDSVLEASQVARGCLYNYFDNKDALCYEAVDYLLKKNDDQVISVVSREQTAKSKIYAYLKFNKDPLDTFIEGGCPILNLAAEADDNNPVIKEKLKANMLAAQKYFTVILKEGIRSGEFSKRLQADEFAYKMFASIQGGILISRVIGNVQPMQAIIKSIKAELKTFETE